MCVCVCTFPVNRAQKHSSPWWFMQNTGRWRSASAGPLQMQLQPGRLKLQPATFTEGHVKPSLARTAGPARSLDLRGAAAAVGRPGSRRDRQTNGFRSRAKKKKKRERLQSGTIHGKKEEYKQLLVKSELPPLPPLPPPPSRRDAAASCGAFLPKLFANKRVCARQYYTGAKRVTLHRRDS